MIRQPTHAPDPPPLPGRAGAGGARARIALAHDWLVGYRGGEAVLDRIARVAARLGETHVLYTMFDDGRPLTPAIDALAHETPWIARLPGASGPLRRWMLPLYPSMVASLSRLLAREHKRRPFDLIISTSSAAIKGLLPPLSTGGKPVPHLCYCHSPARYLWSQSDEYARGRHGGLRAMGLSLFGDRLRRWDRATADERHITRILANSTHTAAEVERCWRRQADVVFPPVRTEFFTPPPGPGHTREPFWLLAGALEPYKRADLAIDAARLAGRRLVVVGTGSQESRLRAAGRRRAGQGGGDHVTFMGRVPDQELRRLYRTAELLIFPQVEDFGIIAVEAQACGLPVVARRAGGALDTVIDGITGALFDEPTPEAIAAAAARAPRGPTVAAACRRNAERFSEAGFDAAILAHATALLNRGPA